LIVRRLEVALAALAIGAFAPLAHADETVIDLDGEIMDAA